MTDIRIANKPDRDGGHPKCGRCEVLPQWTFDGGRLLMKFPLGHSSGKLHRRLIDAGWPLIDHGDYIELALDRDDTRVLLLEEGEMPGAESWWRAESLLRLCGRVSGQWLSGLLAAEGLTTMFHPILRLGEPLELFA